MHIPQSLQTFTELEHICLVPNHIISPASSKPIIEITQDNLLGAYLITIRDLKIRKDQMYNYMMFSKKYNGILPEPAGIDNNEPYWTGKQLYSLILPDININQIKTVKIIRGIITEGYLNGDSLGGDAAGLIKQIYNAYGMEACNDFLNDTQKLITRWMMDNSFTIGFGDCTVNKEQRKTVKEITNKYIEESYDLIRKAQHGVFANDLDDAYKASNLDYALTKIFSTLSEKVKDYLMETIPKSNNFYQAGDKGSGAKGVTTNIQQIMGCVGQQDIWGSRIEDGFTERTLPHFARNDVGPDAKGFCRNSFIEGLSPSETFFHAMGGRTGTIDTAIKSVTGDTPIIIMEEGIVKHVNIGDWIDRILDSRKDKVQNLPEKEMELLELDYEAHIPTTDLDGNVSWGIIKNITRHDPGKELYEIKTHGGRNVIVTESHSLLIWNGKQFERMSTPNVKVGDFVPVTRSLPSVNNYITVDINNKVNNIIINGYYESSNDEDRDLTNMLLNMRGIETKLNGNFIHITSIGNHQNDTVLDAITEINKIDISRYSKVYDLTIPSTLNFGLANGLHVVDTADSGYLSRKFIKAAEDIMINYDFTVRNASNHIVQFSYGDDNFDPIKLEKVTRIELIEYDNNKMEEQYKFDSVDDVSYFETFMTPGAIKEMMQDDNYKNLLNDEYEEMLQYRRDLRYRFFNNTEAIGDVNTYIPINLYRVIPSQLIKYNIEKFHLTDLTPKFIIDTYEETMRDIVKYLPEKDNNWILFKIIFKSFLASKKVMREYRMTKAAYQNIILLIKEKMLSALIHPGEMVGIIGAQTLGEISTQLTLNSVTYETEIIVRNNNKEIKKVQIGEFIENEIRKSGKIQYMEDKDTTYAECAEYWEVQAPDEDGNIIWDRIEAVTKHPVINRDGSNTMLKITTEDEREVIATKAKSFLKLVNGKIVPVDGENLKVGDYLPISTKEVEYKENFSVNLKNILLPSEYVYGSELEKAKSVMKEHHWWMKHSNKTFTLPHGRSDSVVRLINSKASENIQNDCVYMLLTNMCEYKIPEELELDYNFGYLVGAYAAEGCMTKHQISISNNDASYFEPINELCNKWNITTKIYRNENKNKEGWTSQDIRIYNTVLCRILEKFVGKLSHNKFISDEIIFSNKECLKGFLDAYIGGDGHVDNSRISMSSVSKKMLEQVMIILSSFGIFSHIYKPPKQETNNRGSLDIKQIYVLYISGKQSKKLANILNMKIKHKQDSCELMKTHNHIYEYTKKFEMIPNEIDGEIVFESKEGRFIDTVFSKIKSIKEVQNSKAHAFDLTVEKTKNFLISNFLCCRDTFHLSGVGAGSLVITQGVPRLREIINVSKNLKSKNMDIYLKDEYAISKDSARKIQTKFAFTQLKDILLKTEIIFDNKYGMTEKNEDNEFIKSYKEFAELFDTDNIDETCLSPWILRLTFDKEALMNKKITIQEIQETIKENFHNDQEIDCIYSDDSVNDVIMRIRIKQDSKGNFLEFMKDFEKQLIGLSLRGITDINQVECTESNIIKYNSDGTSTATKEWMLKTSGSNLLDILADEAVDSRRTITNDIIEFHEVFGIEATREMLYKELHKVFSGKPNPRHLQLLSDIMTYRGKLMQIDRHGLNKNPEIGPIGKASFEEVMNIFTKAALFAEKDNMKGVSANILAGQFCKSGTNVFDILIDEEKMMQKIDIPDYVDTEEYVDVNEKDINKAFSNTYSTYEPTEAIDDKDFSFGFGMEETKHFSLEKIETKNLKVSETKSSNSETETVNFEKITINEPLVENNIDFNAIEINEPKYNENEELEKEPETKPKKIRIKKVKDEEEPKKKRTNKK